MILVCGEALFDVFVAAEGGTRIPAEMVVGGSPLNVAVGLARLGATSSYFSGLSTDRFGEILRATLANEGVDLSHVRAKDNLTTLSIVARGDDGQPRYTFYGADAADRMVTPEDLPRKLADDVRAITMGSYTLVVKPVADALAAFAEREGARRVISLDPNLRPTVIGDVSRWPAQFDRFARHATIVKASDEDIEIAFGGALSIAEAAARWHGLGAQLVVVTRGRDGALGFPAGGDTVEVPGRRVAVVDTVGAGDTFHAAMLAELDRRGRLTRDGVATLDSEALGEVLRYAVTASSITCTRRGADLPRAAEVAAALA
ncbi:carbohydrate kinase [Alsobacter sp. SYSU M60028]|uniref:Carbohydrate kinase n=1 Tax=Alsobacter ponti TaxID=2962936 RepID=A0ABT1LCD5_9HYPH|nr:carbohydrate kinase [Alsobacter ponti]MCP8938405.1 carbohydrate kinase [Alsobacter ponti]